MENPIAPRPYPGPMALIGPESTLPDSALREIYVVHVAGIRGLVHVLEEPPYPVTDVARIDLAHSFAQHLLDALRAVEPDGSRAALVHRVNLSYEGMLILIDYAKTYTDGPRVPRGGSTPSNGPPKEPADPGPRP